MAHEGMVHALTETHRVLKPNGILLDVRPAAQHRRIGLGVGKGWRFVGTMREPLHDDLAADRAVRQVMRDGLFRCETHTEINIERVMDTLQDFRAWIDDFSRDNIPSHEWLHEKVERGLAKKPYDTTITVRGPLKIELLRKIG